MNEIIKSLESARITEGGMVYSPDVLVFGIAAWFIFNLLYFISAALERKWFGTDRLSRTNTVILMQVLFVSMCLMFLDGERLKTRAAWGLPADGIVGPKTITYINTKVKFDDLWKFRKDWFIDICLKDSTQFVNLKGWLNRLYDNVNYCFNLIEK